MSKSRVLRLTLVVALLGLLISGLFVGETQIHRTLYIGLVGEVYAITPDYQVDGVNDHVEIIQALDALPDTGGKIVLLSGTFALGATIERTTDAPSITIQGEGPSTLINYNASTAVISDEGQNNWTIRDLETDAGGVSLTGTNSHGENVILGGTYHTYYSASTGDGIVVLPANVISGSEIYTSTDDAGTSLSASDLGVGAPGANEGFQFDGSDWQFVALGNATDLSGLDDADVTGAADADIFIFNGGAAEYRDQAMSGGATIDNAGVITLDGESVDDLVDALINDGDSVHTRITITYDDVNNAMDFIVDDMNDDIPEAADYSNLTGGAGIDNSPIGTLTFNGTELSTLVWDAGGNATFTHTFDLSGTDPVVTYSSGVINISTGELQEGGFPVFTTNDGALDDDDLSDDDLDALQNVSALSEANGDILYYDGSWKVLVKDVDGEVLKLSGGLPIWDTDATGGGGGGSGNATRSVVFVVAASDAHPNVRDAADYTTSGANDDVEIQAAIDALTARDGIIQLSEGNFYTSANITIPGGTWLRGMGLRTVIWPQGNVTGAAFTIEGTNQYSIALTDFLIDGTNGGASAVGIDYTGARSIRIENVQVTNMGGSGIFADGFIASSNNSSLRKITATNNGVDGLRLVSVYAFRVSESFFGSNTENGLTLSSGGEGSITTSIFDQNTGRGIYLFSVNGVLIQGNSYIGENQQAGIGVGGSTNDSVIDSNIIMGNNRSNGSFSGIRLANTPNKIQITNNHIWDDEGTPTQEYGIDIVAGNNTVISNNTFDNNSSGAINDGGTNTTIGFGNIGYQSAFKAPSSDGTNGQALITDGSGIYSWGDITGGGTDIYFGVIDPPAGTNPTATSGNETLTITGTRVTITGTIATGTLDFTVDDMTANTQLTQEQVEDIAGNMTTGNTETFISVDYQDGDSTIDYVVPVKDEDDMSSDSDTDLSTQQSIKAYVDAQDHTGGSPTANDISYDIIAGATYDTLQEWLTISGSSGIFTGGNMTSNGDGTVNVAGGTGIIRTTNSETSDIVFFDFSGNTSVSLTDNSVNYVHINYNAGSPEIQVSTSQSILFDTTKVAFATIFRDGNTLHVRNVVSDIADYVHRNNIRNFEIEPVTRTSGMTLTDNGNLTFALSAGVMYLGIDRVTSLSFDTGASDVFDYYWTDDSGATWTMLANQQTINNTQYNDITSGLTALTSNRYAVVWVYLDFDGENLHAVYGRGDYTLIQAEDAQPPAVLPPVISQYSILVSKIVIKKSTTSMIVFSPFGTAFTGAFVENHNDLGGLDGGTSGEYYHFTSAEYTEVTGWVDDVTLGSSGALTLPSGQNFTIGSDTWNSGDLINAAKVADADLGMVSTSGGSWTVEDFALNTDADAGDFDILSLDKLEFFDAAIYIDGGTDGQLDIEGDIINILGPTDFAANAVDMDSNTITLSTVAGTVNMSGATEFILPSGTDPDVTTTAAMSVDTDDESIRVMLGGNQSVMAKKIEIRSKFQIEDPDSINTGTGRADKWAEVFTNDSGFTLYITKIEAKSDSDDYVFDLYETNGSYDYSQANDTLIESVTCSTDGTGIFYSVVSGASIDHSVIETGNAILFVHNSSTTSKVVVTIWGWYDGDVD